MGGLTTALTAALLSAGIVAAGQAAEVADPGPDLLNIGECRITTYCPACNDGSGHESSSGTYLRSGHAACSFLPAGTVIDIEGERFTIVDVCGVPGTIDIFKDDDSGTCNCSLLEYKNVCIVRKGEER